MIDSSSSKFASNVKLQQRINKLENHHAFFLSQLEKTYNRRLTIGLVTFSALVMAAFYPKNLALNAFGFIFGPLLFAYFYIASHRLKKYCQSIAEWLNFLHRQEQRGQGFLQFNAEKELPSSNAAHIRDLDLLTQQGLFDLIDETITPGGQKKLVDEIVSLRARHDEILERQKTVSTLKKHHWLLTRLVLVGRLHRDFKDHTHQLSDVVSRPFLESAFHRDYWILKGLFVLSIFGLANQWTGWSPELSPFFFLSIYFVYSLVAASNLKGVFERSNDMSIQLSSLMPVMQFLEKRSLHPDLARLLKNMRRFSPSLRMKKLNFIIASLSIQAHPLVFILVNGLLPWSFFFAKKLEKQREIIKDDLPGALDDLYNFEFFASLALLAHYQTAVFPKVLSDPGLEFTQAFHPLIPRQDVVANSFSLQDPIRLNVITGSNMSGKSSFLRTIGVNHVLLLLGAPVFAKAYASYPFRLASCIRVTDALDGGISYFYAEVLRLKEIMHEAGNEPPILYLIDEIFRGTNNRERLIGSQSVLEKLAESSSVGFVTTHDLELTKLAEQFEKVENWHFRDDVENGEMVFNYRLLPGPCPTTNALKIMKKSGLPVKNIED